MAKLVAGVVIAAVGAPGLAMATGACCHAGSWCCGWCPFCC